MLPQTAVRASSQDVMALEALSQKFYDVLRLPMTSYDIPTRLVAVIGKVTQDRREPVVS
jgi:hypothetical protein